MPNYLESICPLSLSFLLDGYGEWKVQSRESRTAWQPDSPELCCDVPAMGMLRPARQRPEPGEADVSDAEFTCAE